MYIIDFENNDYCMCYSPKDKCTIKIFKKDATIRDATAEDETTFGVSLDDDSNDDRTTVSSETTDSQIFGDSNITRSTSISDFSNMSEEDRTLKSPRSARGFNPLRGLQDLKVFSSKQKLTSLSAGKTTLNGDDKVHDLHSIISSSSSSSSVTDDGTLNPPPPQHHSHPQLSPRNLTEEYVPTLPIIKKNSDFLHTIEERKKTLVRRDATTVSPGGDRSSVTMTSTRPPWLAELEGKKLSKVIPGEQDYVYTSPKTPVQ
ncbi:hypothetical protein C9374_007661 [Naegleria lovaniensis]|uniref:Uncharacterized protein n=1 Tax=Naegleria lovaniensis TaxID=51637 RepID=A0AA88GI54_NAELO|nr:uncharacterized protein C9374_007661 [Naegleria lovaniensis]KAG2379023.1 hypothetical protein C9374_007661 [Naegleria lovaniensis]